MSIFGTDVVLFSPMQSRLTYQGKPAAGAKIVRHLIWKDEIGEKEIFYANETGDFDLPTKKDKLRIPMLGEFVIAQQLSVIFDDTEYIIWYKGSSGFDKHSGLGGYLKNVRCELTDESVRIKEFNALFTSSCKWDSIVSSDSILE